MIFLIRLVLFSLALLCLVALIKLCIISFHIIKTNTILNKRESFEKDIDSLAEKISKKQKK